MKLQDIQLVETVFEIGHVGRAALKLGLSQSAVSKAIQRIEADYGLRLFERAPRGVVPTADGTALRERFQQVGMAFGDLDAAASDLRASRAGSVRLGVIPARVSDQLEDALVELLSSLDGASYRINVQISDILLEQLEAATLDLAIATVPAHCPDSLTYEPLRRQPMNIVVRDDHPLLLRPCAPASLRGERWLLPGADISIRQMVESLFVQHGIGKPEVAVEVDSSPAVFAHLVARTDLLTVIGPMTLRNLSAPLSIWPLPLPHSSTTLALFHRRKGYLSPAVRRVRNAIVSRFAGP